MFLSAGTRWLPYRLREMRVGKSNEHMTWWLFMGLIRIWKARIKKNFPVGVSCSVSVLCEIYYIFAEPQQIALSCSYGIWFILTQKKCWRFPLKRLRPCRGDTLGQRSIPVHHIPTLSYDTSIGLARWIMISFKCSIYKWLIRGIDIFSIKGLCTWCKGRSNGGGCDLSFSSFFHG